MCREEAGLQAAPSHERLELYVHHVPVGGYGRKVQWGLEAVFENDFHYLPERLQRKTDGLAPGCNAYRLKCDLPKYKTSLSREGSGSRGRLPPQNPLSKRVSKTTPLFSTKQRLFEP